MRRIRVGVMFAACVALFVPGPGCDRTMPQPQSKSQLGRAKRKVASNQAGDKAPSDTRRDGDAKQAPTVRHTGVERGAELYQRHCAACHGERGDGKGLAAAFLFPKPRDFRAGRFRLVSTVHGVPTTEDLDRVLVRGMPGSAMLSWAHLNDEDRKLLAAHVKKLHADGIRESLVAEAAEDDEEPDEKEIRETIVQLTTPGKIVPAPAAPRPGAASVARGATLYKEKGCAACHGATGKGDGQQAMIDAEGLPTRPRDLTLGIFKGSPDFASVFRRIRNGMPGSPMPSSQSLTDEEVTDMVHFVLSLSDEATREAVVLKRRLLTAGRVVAAAESPGDELWRRVKPVKLTMTPLWWRADHDAGLEAQAMHDGKTLAVRLCWNDPRADQRALRSEAFKDAAAIEFYRGDAEPFVGMGAAGSPVDVWMWDADTSAGPADVEDANPRMAVDVYPITEGAVETAEYHRPGTATAAQSKVTLPARAAGNRTMPPRERGRARDLEGAGPGTLTFRLPVNREVRAQGTWRQGRWQVVLSRALKPDQAGAGILLQPRQRVSVAFALWNGSLGDRDGQKLITIWQDLVLEP